ncbi:MAG: protein kinase [Alphaproteobacteria bacterium]|nr:protein kinase [Alphaproteobacteria bacterium]
MPGRRATFGRFEVKGFLGQGGMGRVLRGEHVGLGAQVAIKLLTAEGMANRAILKAFGNEARAVAALNHPGIVRILDYGEVPEAAAEASGGELIAGSPYLVMPLAEGGTLSRWGGRLEWTQLRTLLMQLLDALGHAHARGVIHRDIKPGNVLLVEPDDPTAGAWLADFGLVRLAEERHPGAVVLHGGGTPPYMAPEQKANDLGAQGPWTDLYALGQLAVFMAVDSRRVNRRMRPPWGFDAWLDKLLARDPAERFQFAAHASEALARLDVGAPTFSTQWRDDPPPPPLLPAMSPAVLSLRPPPMVGRVEERNQLWNAALSLRRGQSLRVLRVEGPAGSGRTRLADWLAEQTHERGLARTLRVRFSEGSASAQDPIAEGLAACMRVQELSARKLERRLDALLPEARWTAASRRQLAELLLRSASEVPSVRVGPQPARLGLLRRAILELARPEPLLLILDDIHRDAEAIQLLESLCAPAGRDGTALLVVLTTSPEELSWHPGEAAALEALSAEVEVVALRPLSEEEHAALVRGILGVPRGLVAEVIQRTLGDPRFAVNLVRHQVESQALVAQDGQWRRVGEAPLPDALQDLYTQRLLRLMGPWPADAQRALLLASLLGVQVDDAEWERACAAMGLQPAWGLLDALLRAGLVLPREGAGWRFASSLVQACLAEMAAQSGEAERMHLACAEALPKEEVERRAMHLLGAGRRRQALAPLTEALQLQVRAQRLDRAEHLAELWLDLGASIGVTESSAAGWAALASLRVGQGQLDEASELAERAAEAAAQQGDAELQASALRVASLVAWHRGDAERLVALSQEAVRVVTGRARARAQLDLAFGLNMLGRATEAMAQALAAELQFREMGDAHGALDALRFRSNALVQDPDYEQALALSRELREQADALGSVESAAAGWINEGEIQRHRGELEAAALAFQRGAELLDAVGSAHGLVGWVSVGVVWVEQGRHGEGRRQLEACLGLARARGLSVYEGYIVAWLLRAIAGLGAWEAARPEWAHAELSIARVYGEEMFEALERAGRSAELASEIDAADLCWSLALSVAARVEDAAAVERARAGLQRVDALMHSLSRGVPTAPPGTATLPPEL